MVFTDMDDDCFPTISMNTACGRLTEGISIKDEPFSETDSPTSSCPSSPHSNFIPESKMDTEIVSTLYYLISTYLCGTT